MTTEEWHAEAIGAKVCAALEKNNFAALFCKTRSEALSWIEKQIHPGMTIGIGGSMTLREIGIHGRSVELGATLLDHSAPGLTPEQKMDTMRAQLTCDLFLSGTNAVTLNGELYNVDGNGNRIAALTFGPKKTVVVVGVNKIVRNLAEAEARIALTAAPQNVHRLDIPTPCAKTGVCMDCDSERRICRIYSILKRKPGRSDFTVLVIGESLGY